jgi:hypothetical protein
MWFVELCSPYRPSPSWLMPGTVGLPEHLQADNFLPIEIKLKGLPAAKSPVSER